MVATPGNALNLTGSAGLVKWDGTSVVSTTAITQHDILVGGSSNAITSVAPSATSGVPLISQGSSSDPAFGTAVVAGGGTGLSSTTAYGVICGGTSTTGNFQNTGTGAAASTVLIGNGSSALPSFSATPKLTGLGIGATSTGSGLTFDGSNTLANYVVGTWTPAIAGDGTTGTTTYTAQHGFYTRIGNVVYIVCYVACSAMTGTGDIIVSGLPINTNSSSGNYPVFTVQTDDSITFPAGKTFFVGQSSPGTDYVYFPAMGTSTAVALIQCANQSWSFRISGLYFV